MEATVIMTALTMTMTPGLDNLEGQDKAHKQKLSLLRQDNPEK